MLSRLTNVIQQAVEALAPSMSRREDFVYHWKSVTNYFMDHKDGKVPIEQTNIPSHLGEMLKLIVDEEEECEKGSTGPCMEYLLQHKLLETLYTLGRTDFPPGMKQAVLAFFTKLLSRVHQPILPHISVHRAVYRLIKICGEIIAGPTEIEEIQFLCTVCSQIKMHPYLANFFLENAQKDTTSVLYSNGRQDIGLISSLLTLSHSEDGRVAVKACEGLMLCASLPDNHVAGCIAHETPFCQEMTNRLCQLYEHLPHSVDPMELENVQAKWGLDILPDRDDSTTFAGKRRVISFLSWLDYYDQLIALSNPILVGALTASIRDNFLLPIMEPSLLQASETRATLATVYLTCCLRTVSSAALLRVFVYFLLGEDRETEEESQAGHRLRQRLIDHCNHLSDEVTIATLKLFGTLLIKDDEHIVTNLVLRNLVSRGYREIETPNATAKNADTSGETRRTDTSEDADRHSPSSSLNHNETLDELANTESDFLQKLTPSVSMLGDSDVTLSSSALISSTLAEPEQTHSVPMDVSEVSDSSQRMSVCAKKLQQIINWFLMLVPNEAKSSLQTTESGYDSYLRDAHKQFTDCKAMCRPWGWPVTPVANDAAIPPAFYSGSFLDMLLDKLSRILTQSYDVNLHVSSVLSKLALLPHPNLHEYLLDPYLPLRQNVRTPLTVFSKVVAEIKQHVKSDPQLSAKLVCVRQKLLNGDFLNTRLAKSQSSNKNGNEETRTLEAIIVLEEFCKELAAVVFVKHHDRLMEV